LKFFDLFHSIVIIQKKEFWVNLLGSDVFTTII